MVSAKASDQDKIDGLIIGADDYITKPFSAREMIARIRALLRRKENLEISKTAVFRCDSFQIDFNAQRVMKNGHEVDLTVKEYRLLSCLAKNAGRVMTYGQLMNNVWGEEYVGGAHLLHVNISRLKRKLEDTAGHAGIIQSRRGIGYIVNKKDTN